MRESKLIKPAAFSVSLVLLLGYVVWVSPPDMRAITIFFIEGDVSMAKSGGRSFSAKEGYLLNDGYTLETGPGSVCYLQMNTDAILQIKELSRIIVTRTARNKLTISVLSGGVLTDAGTRAEGGELEARVGNTGLTVRGLVFSRLGSRLAG